MATASSTEELSRNKDLTKLNLNELDQQKNEKKKKELHNDKKEENSKSQESKKQDENLAIGTENSLTTEEIKDENLRLKEEHVDAVSTHLRMVMSKTAEDVSRKALEAASINNKAQFIRVFDPVELIDNLVKTIPLVDEFPNLFKLSTTFNEVFTFGEKYLDNILPMENAAFEKMIADSRELFKPGTLAVWFDLEPSGHFSCIPNPNNYKSTKIISRTVFLNNRNPETTLKKVFAGFEAFSALAANYKFLIKNQELINVGGHEVMNVQIMRDFLADSKIFMKSGPHPVLGALYNKFGPYVAKLNESFGGPGNMPKFGRAALPSRMYAIKTREFAYTNFDQYSAELGYLIYERIERNRLLDHHYLNLLTANSSLGIDFVPKENRPEELIMIPGIDRAGWNRVLMMMILDDDIKIKMFRTLVKLIEDRSLFDFRPMDRITMTLNSDEVGTNLAMYLTRLGKYKSSSKIVEAIVLELMSGVIYTEISPPNLIGNSAQGIFEYVILLMHFVLWPKTFWSNVHKFSTLLYEFFRITFPNQFTDFKRRNPWIIKYNARTATEGEFEPATGKDHVLSDRDFANGMVPIIFTDQCQFQPRGEQRQIRDIFDIYDLIRPEPENINLNRKNTAGYPYYRDDYVGRVVYDYSRTNCSEQGAIYDKLDRLRRYFNTIIKIWESKPFNRAAGVTRPSYRAMETLMNAFAIETAVLFKRTIGVLYVDGMDSFPYMYDDFCYERPYRYSRYFGLSSVNDNRNTILYKRRVDHIVPSQSYDIIVTSASGIIDRASNILGSDAPITHGEEKTVQSQIGIELTDFSLSIYNTAEKLCDAMVLIRGLLDDDVPYMDMFRRHTRPYMTNSNFMFCVKKISETFKLPIDSYFQISYNGIIYVQEGRYVIPSLVYVDFDGGNSEWNTTDMILLNDGNVFAPLPEITKVLSIADMLFFSNESPIYRRETGITLGLFSFTIQDPPTFSTNATDYLGDDVPVVDYLVHETFTPFILNVDTNSTLTGVKSAIRRYRVVIDDEEYVVVNPNADAVPMHILRIPYLSDVLNVEAFVEFVAPLIARKLLYIELTHQSFEYTTTINVAHRAVICSPQEINVIARLTNEVDYVLELNDFSALSVYMQREMLRPSIETSVLPTNEVTLKNCLFRNIYGAVTTLPDNFCEFDVKNWAAGFDDQRNERYGVFMPGNNIRKIESLTVNFNNVFPTLGSLAIVDYPTYEISTIGVTI